MTEEALAECHTAVRSGQILIEQLRKSVRSRVTSKTVTDSTPPLTFLSTVANNLKATTTRLSLLAITSPFTPSAILTLMKGLNDTTLPSLTIAASLVSVADYPEAFSHHCNALVDSAFIEFNSLLGLVKLRCESPFGNVPEEKKQSVTEATGRVWAACDAITAFAQADVVAFLVKKADQWLALMKDAVQELQDWDPEELVDDPFGEVGSDAETEPKSSDEVTIAAGVKEQVLKVLTRIPQSVHVLIRQRLTKMPLSRVQSKKKILDQVLTKLKTTSECIDESAESMYLGNPESSLKKAGEARAITIDAVAMVVAPWVSGTENSKEDEYIKRALLWVQNAKMEEKG